MFALIREGKPSHQEVDNILLLLSNVAMKYPKDAEKLITHNSIYYSSFASIKCVVFAYSLCTHCCK